MQPQPPPAAPCEWGGFIPHSSSSSIIGCGAARGCWGLGTPFLPPRSCPPPPAFVPLPTFASPPLCPALCRSVAAMGTVPRPGLCVGTKGPLTGPDGGSDIAGGGLLGNFVSWLLRSPGAGAKMPPPAPPHRQPRGQDLGFAPLGTAAPRGSPCTGGAPGPWGHKPPVPPAPQPYKAPLSAASEPPWKSPNMAALRGALFLTAH